MSPAALNWAGLNRAGQARVPSSAVGIPNDIAFVALGSNLGDRAAHLRAGLAAFHRIVGERAQLLSKNEQARTRVEAMIQRLKSLEQSA